MKNGDSSTWGIAVTNHSRPLFESLHSCTLDQYPILTTQAEAMLKNGSRQLADGHDMSSRPPRAQPARHRTAPKSTQAFAHRLTASTTGRAVPIHTVAVPAEMCCGPQQRLPRQGIAQIQCVCEALEGVLTLYPSPYHRPCARARARSSRSRSRSSRDTSLEAPHVDSVASISLFKSVRRQTSQVNFCGPPPK